MLTHLQDYRSYLILREREPATISKYTHALSLFSAFLSDRPLTKYEAIAWKKELLTSYAPVTVNGYLSALNGYLEFIGLADFKVGLLKVQREIYRDESRDLTRSDYDLLITTARTLGRHRLALIMETICSCGLRISELQFVTVESLSSREAVVRNKGKTRTVRLPKKLRAKLREWCREQGIKSGAVFVTRKGRPLCRQQVWREMKELARAAGVEASKVFPHQLRHLFAVEYYRMHRDVVKLADILGHSSVNTTRIYLMETGAEHERQLEELGLVA